MTRIPSTQQTDDFIFRYLIKKGAPHSSPDILDLLEFDGFVSPAGPIHSIDVTMHRDRKPAPEIELRSIEYMPQGDAAFVLFKFRDRGKHVAEHEYVLTAILRYFAAHAAQPAPELGVKYIP